MFIGASVQIIRWNSLSSMNVDLAWRLIDVVKKCQKLKKMGLKTKQKKANTTEDK